jgi:hypothetical protein
LTVTFGSLLPILVKGGELLTAQGAILVGIERGKLIAQARRLSDFCWRQSPISVLIKALERTPSTLGEGCGAQSGKQDTHHNNTHGKASFAKSTNTTQAEMSARPGRFKKMLHVLPQSEDWENDEFPLA